jgi:hypothetical protein
VWLWNGSTSNSRAHTDPCNGSASPDVTQRFNSAGPACAMDSVLIIAMARMVFGLHGGEGTLNDDAVEWPTHDWFTRPAAGLMVWR